MEDHRPRRGPPDLSAAASDQDPQIRDLAEKYGISIDEVQQLIATLGHDSTELEAAAKKLGIEGEEGSPDRDR
ncbi:hypothetical protein [Rhodoligotrophos ferricapiens]|uniref:hypothetical protein n=1 Tax=Rhodoligotrophos ferricapiens TaxID=3069264 RepID=UPI00315D2525